MASKVNVKFVVMLSVVIGVIVAGVGVTGFFILTHSGAELEAMGDQAMKDKDFKNAILYYGRSFSNDKANIDRLKKYCTAMVAFTPDNQSLYNDYYWHQLIPAKKLLAGLLKDDVSAQADILDAITRNMYENSFDRNNWNQIIEVTETSLAPFEAAPVPGWEKLKRYRGLALVEIASNGNDLDDKQAATLESDLQAALAVDPNDEQATLGLVGWYSLNAAKAADRADTTSEATLRAKAQSLLAAYRTAHPDSVLAALSEINAKVQAASRQADPKKMSAEQRLKVMRTAAAALEPDLAAIFDIVRRVGPDKVESTTLYRLDQLERYIRNNKDDEARALVKVAIERQPGKAELHLMAGRMAEDRADEEDAINAYQALLDLPVPPLSLEGVELYQERLQSLARQAEAAIGIWERLSPAPREGEDADQAKKRYEGERAAALVRVKDFHDKLAREVGPNNLALMLIEAKLAYAHENYTQAQGLLQDYLRQTNTSDPDSLLLAGNVAMRLNQPGIAQDHFKRLTEIQPANPRAWDYLGDVQGMLDDHQDAMTSYREALSLNPEDAYAKEKVQQLRQVVSHSSDDPAKNLMFTADKYWTGAGGIAPDRDAAVRTLEQAIAQFPDNADIAAMLATYYYNVGRLDEAKAVCAKGRQLAPNSDRLRQLQIVLEAPDPYTATLQLIDESPMSDIQKLIAKVGAARKYAQADEAKKYLDLAVQAAPDDPSVIEFRFTDAITGKRLPEAATIADQATAANLDRLGGATYKARLLVAQDKKAEAIEVLKGATQNAAAPGGAAGGKTQSVGLVTPEVWRFLAEVQSEQGQATNDDHMVEAALASLNEALRMRPNDLATIIDTLKTYIHLNRYEPALNLARASETVGRSSPEFRDLWLRLEASVGDKEQALRQRRGMLKDQPSNDINKLALLQTDLDTGQFAEARTLLDDLRKKQDSLILVQLDAKWHSDQGDREGARKLYLDYIAAEKASGNASGSGPYLAMAQFLLNVGDTQGGLDALQEARQFQDPKALEVDRVLGLTLAEIGKQEPAKLTLALPILEGFLKAGVPDDVPSRFAVRSAHVETLIRMGKYAEAEQSIDAAGPEAGQTMSLLLLRASARQGQSDVPGAVKLVNDAISKYPSDPLGYLKRAELTSSASESLDDALADLDTAIRLRPDLYSALQLRALLKIRQGRQDDALDDLRTIVRLKPEVPGPRNALLQTLIEANKFNEALDIANSAANQRPRDLPLLMGLGDLFSTYAGKPGIDALGAAQRFYQAAWQLGPNPKVAVIYTRSLLSTPRPNLPLVDQILSTPELRTDQNPELLMNRAVMLNRQGKFDLSRAGATQALRLVIKSPGDTSVMLDQLRPVFGDPDHDKNDMANLDGFIQSLDMSGLPDVWPDFFRARFKFLDPQGGQEEALSRLRTVVATAQDPTLQNVARQFLSAALIGIGERLTREGNTAGAHPLYEEAVDVIRGALKLDPNNVEALNNGAYVLTENLKRPEEALPMAEQAVKVAPDKGAFWDTLGLVYLELGRFDDADKALNRAVAAGGSMDDRMELALKLIRVKIGKQDRAAAQKIVDQANTATGRLPELKSRYQARLDTLQKDVDALR